MWGMQCWIKTAGICSSLHGVKPEPDIHPGRVRRAVSGAVACRPRPNRRFDRVADHGRRSRRPVVTAYLLTSTVAGPLYGKFGDLYGRKIVLQVAIAVFLVGSALCGIAQNMVQLIVFRALEGAGGGGLIVITIAVIGDLIPPRERGPYQGFFAAVFGVATLVGAVVGGFFVDHLSWGWIFYITLPTGILALAVIAAVLPSGSTRRQHAVDYLGALLLTAALSAVILFTGLGGRT